MPKRSGLNQTSLKFDMPWALRHRFEDACRLVVNMTGERYSQSEIMRRLLDEFSADVERQAVEAQVIPPASQ